MTDEFLGPPWQMDWRLDALADREALPESVREMVDEARAELVTAKGRSPLTTSTPPTERP
ncbi:MULTISPECIES: hypothetical protein [unclassified Streptomyces]|uniref:hypothetical protein n=1 Tax=unclassified Streptomyces TaxID=2593676 RepID=UPI0030789E93